MLLTELPMPGVVADLVAVVLVDHSPFGWEAADGFGLDLELVGHRIVVGGSHVLDAFERLELS